MNEPATHIGRSRDSAQGWRFREALRIHLTQ